MFKKPTANPETCERCPNRFSERGCPCWINGITEVNEVTGEARAFSGCYYEVMPRWVQFMVTGWNRTAAAVCDTRNEVVARQDALAEGLRTAVGVLGQGTLLSQVEFTPLALEAQKDG